MCVTFGYCIHFSSSFPVGCAQFTWLLHTLLLHSILLCTIRQPWLSQYTFELLILIIQSMSSAPWKCRPEINLGELQVFPATLLSELINASSWDTALASPPSPTQPSCHVNQSRPSASQPERLFVKSLSFAVCCDFNRNTQNSFARA